jgi:hypothetical protein
MGYRYKKVNNRKILCEKSYVKVLKVKFLKKYMEYLNSNEDIIFIYLDETRLYTNGSPVTLWIDENTMKANPKIVKAEGKRLTILHAGCVDGFLGCDLMLDTKIEHHDYHQTMNGVLFKSWVETQLIPAINRIGKKCVIIMDNTPYHSVRTLKNPKSNSNKDVYKKWLADRNMSFEEC